MYIEKINGPEDVKKLTVDEMTVMAGEMREALLKRASIHGGHFGPNFGMVEATICLLYTSGGSRLYESKSRLCGIYLKSSGYAGI